MEPWQDEAEKAWSLLSWEGEIQWFAAKEEPGGNKKVMGGRLCSLDALIGTIRNSEALSWNLYCNANPTRRTGKIKVSREDVTHWRYVVIDMDPVGEVLTPPGETWMMGVAYRIYSGRGYQYWVPVERTPELSTKDYYLKAEQAMAGIIRSVPEQSGWVADTSCSDLARVVRCPGSINQKTGRRAIVEREAATGPTMNILLEYAEQAPEIQERTPIANSGSFIQVWPHLTGTAKKFLVNGTGSPGRHSKCFHTAKLLDELGVSKGTAMAWLEVGALRCEPELALSEVGRIIRQVYGGKE